MGSVDGRAARAGEWRLLTGRGHGQQGGNVCVCVCEGEREGVCVCVRGLVWFPLKGPAGCSISSAS